MPKNMTVEQAKAQLTTEQIVEADKGGDDACGQWHEVAADRLTKLAQQQRTSTKVLKELEWCAEAARCPICRAYKPGSHFAQPQFRPWRVGHTTDCELAAALFDGVE